MNRFILWTGLAMLTACGPAPSPPPQKSAHDLLMALRPGPTTWFVGPDGEAAGLDRDLAELFAKEHGFTLLLIPSDSPAGLLAGASRGDVQVAAGGLYRPVEGRSQLPSLLFTRGYFSGEPVLLYNSDGFKPESWADLAGETVGIVDGAGSEPALAKVRAQHPDVRRRSQASPGALIAQVAEGTLDYAVVASNEAALARNIFPGVATAFAVGPKQDLAWALPAREAGLRDLVDAFFARIRRDGTLQRLVDRYFGYVGRVERFDAGLFQQRIRSVLPAYAAMFHVAQQESGVEWRLLAAIAYQESRWDPAATSETSVRGMMMLTEETAKRMRVADRLDARQSILAGARYLAELKAALPAQIAEPDRTWIALAAFNIGIGHLEDARMLAAKRKLDPDSWSDLKKTLPLLALPDVADGIKYGLARGGQAVVFVETVRAYYDVLLRRESPYYGARLKAN